MVDINIADLSTLHRHHKALYLGQVAFAAYLLSPTQNNTEILQNKLTELGLSLYVQSGNPIYDPETGTEGFIATTEAHTIIALKGSWEVDDWRTNLRFRQGPFIAEGHVHAGFAAAALNIVDDVIAALRENPGIYANKPLWLSGHSSGGAIAILLAHLLTIKKIPIAGIYTFGTPKVGDADYAQAYPLRDILHAVWVGGDPTVNLPPNRHHVQDRHVQLETYVHIVEPEKLSGKDGDNFWQDLFTSLAELKTSEEVKRFVMGAGPHGMEGSYLPSLERQSL
jgi:hypothetical protein